MMLMTTGEVMVPVMLTTKARVTLATVVLVMTAVMTVMMPTITQHHPYYQYYFHRQVSHGGP